MGRGRRWAALLGIVARRAQHEPAWYRRGARGRRGSGRRDGLRVGEHLDHRRGARHLPAGAGFTSAVASPIWVEGEPAGVLIGGSRARARAPLPRAGRPAVHRPRRLQGRQRPPRSRRRRRTADDPRGAAPAGPTPRRHGRRAGGDEFGILLEDVSPAEAEGTAERLRAALTEPAWLGGVEVAAGASIGVATGAAPTPNSCCARPTPRCTRTSVRACGQETASGRSPWA